SVLIYGQIDRSGLDSRLGEQGLLSDATIRVRHSWDPQDPDSTLGLAATKKLLGEFAYRVAGDGSVSVDPTWQARYIPAQRELYSGVGIRAACNNVIKADLQAALTEIANAGLAGLIDTANTNSAGGCFGPRFNRISGNLGILSRHSWGQPLDTNTLQNCQGCVPKMDCRIVQIFRSHGFAWGGNFLFPDGMHFEWTGRVTNQLAYPSRYCPNPTAKAAESITLLAPRSTFFDAGSDVFGVAGGG
ncbi:MAG: M15 family metallopeptidase, partial [Ilumatobacteraceae bacterium]